MAVKLTIWFWHIIDALGLTTAFILFINLDALERAILFVCSIVFFLYRIYHMHLDGIKRRLDNKSKEYDVNIKINSHATLSVEKPLLTTDLSYLNDLNTTVNTIFKKTKADRFLILVATNGLHDFKFATALYEQHKENGIPNESPGATDRYVGLRFDKPYLHMLKRVEKEGVLVIDYNTMPECLLKDIYTQEGVRHTKIFFLNRQKKDKSNDVLYFCSVGTHQHSSFTTTEKTVINSAIDLIKERTKQMIKP